MNRIAIIGMSLRIGPCVTVQDFWDLLVRGTDCIGELPPARIPDCAALYPGKEPSFFQAAFLPRIDTFDNEFFSITDREAELMDPRQRILLETSWQALEDAGYPPSTVRGTNMGVFIGAAEDMTYKNWIDNGSLPYHPASVSGNLNAFLANRLSQFFNVTGPSMVMVTSCSSSMVAMHTACSAIRQEECGMALVGGINVFISPWLTNPLGVESPTYRSKPFDEAADGMGTGEGCITLLLKPLEKAERDGDPIHAIVLGGSVSHNGKTANISAPSYSGQANTILKAWKQAQVTPDDIQYMEMHGTGTKIGDAVEAKAVTEVYKETTRREKFPAGSVKSNIGHLGSCAGLAGIVKCVLQMQHQMLVPSIHFNTLNRNIDSGSIPFYINTRVTPWKSRGVPLLCGINSFGIGGTNAHILLAPHATQPTTPSKYPCLFTLSARTMNSLINIIDCNLAFVRNNMHLSLSDICFTLAEKRQHFFYRFAAVCSTMEELAATMEYAIIEGYRSGIQKNYGFSFSSCGFTDSSLIEEDAYGLYQAMNDYLTNGCIDWNSLRFHKEGKALHLPTYRFDAKRFWAAGASSHKPVSRPLRKFHNASDTDITEELRRMFTKVLGVEAVSEKESFFDLGGDSFFAIQLLEDIQQGFGLTLTFENLVQYSSLGELATYIYKKANI